MMLLTADFSSGEVVPTLLPTKTLTLGVTGDMWVGRGWCGEGGATDCLGLVAGAEGR